MHRDNGISAELAFAADEYHREKEYWTARLSSDWVKTRFPYDHEKTRVKETGQESIQPETLKFEIPDQLNARLIQASNASDSRLLMILVTGLMMLLHKYTGNRDIILGTSIDRQEIKGNFINTILVLRNQVEPGTTFKELLFQVRDTLVEAGENQNYPLETLPYELNMPTSGEEFPLFDTAVILENIQDKSYIDHIPVNMLFIFSRNGETAAGRLEYNGQCFQRETAERIVNHYLCLLENSLFNADKPVLELDMMAKEERERLLVEFNRTEAAYPQDKTICQLFVDQVKKTPGKTAAIERDSNRSISYRQLNEQVNQLVLQLKGKLPGKINFIAAVMGERKIGILTAILAVLKAGGIYLPIDAQNPDDRIKFIFADSQAVMLLTQQQVLEKRRHLTRYFNPDHILPVDDQALYTGEAPEPAQTAGPGNNAYIIYTSGTTGKPKGVMVRHRSLVNYIWWAARQYVRNEPLNFPFYTSIAFDLTITSIFTPLVTGNTVIIYGGWDKEVLIERIVEDKEVGVVKITPSHLKLIRTKKITRDNIRRLIVGGEELDVELARDTSKNFKNGVEIFNEYGPTETTVGSMIYRFDPGQTAGSTVPIGIPAANTQIYLLDENREPVPWGAVGEIYISGDGTAGGYLSRPQLTREKFVPNPFIPGKAMYRTGDLARMLADGNIQFMGRTDFQVKIRGFRIELGEIETRIRAEEHIKETVVVLKEDTTRDKYLCAYVVLDVSSPGAGEFNASRLREELLKELPDYMVPRHIVEIPAIPLTANGKLDKRSLPEPRLDYQASYTPPGNKIEQQMVEIWAETLGIESSKIGIDANYFEMGGHSLRATALAAQIHKGFDVRVQLVDIFKRPTVRELADLIKNSMQEQFIPIEPAAKKDYYPLSTAQKRLYILQQMEKTNIGYNMPFVTILEGDPEVNTLEQSFKQLVHRHESFRTQFIMLNQEPVQVILETGAVDFHVDVYEAGEEEADAILREHVQPFDLTRAPLLRVLVIKVRPQRQLLMVDMHHIISDGLSMDIFIREFVSLYEGHELPPLKVQYKDYPGWQNRDEQKNRLKRQEKYWLKELQGDIPVLELPYDYMRPTLKSFDGHSMPFTLARGTSETLKAMAFQYDVTQFMLLFACFTILLYKISGQDDIVIGTPVAGRRHTDLEPIIGIFINSLAIRSRVIPGFSFSDFLHYIKEKTLESFENQDYPFEDLVEKVSPRRDTSRNPLFDVLFTYYSQDLDYNATGREVLDIDIGGLKLKKYEYDYPVSKLDITLHTLEKADHFLFLFEYCTRLFNRETIERFAGYLTRVIQTVVEAPRTRISQIEILPEKEKRQLLFEFNDTDFEYDRGITIHEKFAGQVEKEPDRGALTGKIVITYRELREKSGQLAYALKEKGVGPDSIVAIMMERSPEMMIGIFAILTAGGAYLPIDPDYPQERINYMLADSGAQILLVTKDAPGPQGQVTRQINVSDRTYTSYPSYSPLPQSTTTLAYVIYTSGSTGRPKGVMIRHYSVINRLNWMQRCYPLGEKDVILQKTPVVFDVSVWELFWWSFQGSGLCLLEPGGEKNPTTIIAAIEKENVTTMHFVPSMLSAFLEYIEKSPNFSRGSGLAGLRQVFSSGEALAPHQVVGFNKLIGKPFGIKLINLYGPTEATVDVSYFDCPAGEEEPPVIPIGKPIDNTQLLILGIPGHLQPIGITGELCIAGDGLARGYLNQPGLTAEKFCSITPGYYRSYKSNRSYNTYQSYKIYHTGDIARWLPGGNIEFLGRIDHQVKIRGFRIELEEIAARLANMKDIKAAVVKDYIKQDGQGYLCGYFTADREIPVDEIKQYLLRFLPGYMVPAYFVQMAAMPLTPNGKIDRAQLPAPEIKSQALSRVPRSENEKIVYRLWSEVLPGRQVGIDDSFFSLGGSSIDVIKIAARLTGIFQREIPPLVLFEYPTIRLLSQYLTRSAAPGNVAAPAIDDNSEDRQEALEEAVQLFEEI